METVVINKIDKYEIGSLSFIKQEVLSSPDAITYRSMDLTRALALGNLYKESARIRFETEEREIMETEAKVWAVTEKNVVLKSGITIPIQSIHEISI